MFQFLIRDLSRFFFPHVHLSCAIVLFSFHFPIPAFHRVFFLFISLSASIWSFCAYFLFLLSTFSILFHFLFISSPHFTLSSHASHFSIGAAFFPRSIHSVTVKQREFKMLQENNKQETSCNEATTTLQANPDTAARKQQNTLKHIHMPLNGEATA